MVHKESLLISQYLSTISDNKNLTFTNDPSKFEWNISNIPVISHKRKIS